MIMQNFRSDDNLNAAHGSDQYNPLWYVQTEAYDLQIMTSNVSVHAAYIHCSLSEVLSYAGCTVCWRNIQPWHQGY